MGYEEANNNNNTNSSDGSFSQDYENSYNSYRDTDRDAMPSFGFTQEQVACVCEVS